MITIPINSDGQLTQPLPDNYFAIINNGKEATIYFSVDELPMELQIAVNAEIEPLNSEDEI